MSTKTALFEEDDDRGKSESELLDEMAFFLRHCFLNNSKDAREAERLIYEHRQMRRRSTDDC